MFCWLEVMLWQMKTGLHLILVVGVRCWDDIKLWINGKSLKEEYPELLKYLV